MKKKLLAILLAAAVIGMYTLGSVSSVFADDANTASETEATVTVAFDLNGGSGTTPDTVSATSGSTITLPSSENISRTGYTLVGWSTDSNANSAGSGHYSKTVYAAGSSYTVTSSNVKLYAIWSSSNTTNATFYIRLDGTIPTEPQSHSSSQYTSGITISGAIASGCASFYTDSTNGVSSKLAVVPTDEQIKAVYPNYDPSTQYVLWYVIKNEGTWHVDGVLLEKAKVNLTYNVNTDATDWSNMPDGQQYVQGATATVSSKVPTRTGYTFTGWNTKADGTGTSYASDATFTINEATTLYAQWKANESTTTPTSTDTPAATTTPTSGSTGTTTDSTSTTADSSSTTTASTTYKVVANYYTSTDGSEYVKDNSETVTLKDLASVSVGDTISITADESWATYGGNTYALNENESVTTKVAVSDADSNVITLNYYRSTSTATNTASDNNSSSTSGSSTTGTTTDSSSNNSSSGTAATTSTSTSSNSALPDTGDTSNMIP